LNNCGKETGDKTENMQIEFLLSGEKGIIMSKYAMSNESFEIYKKYIPSDLVGKLNN
jgi:hypothetical protein